jgi:hypothetical protein
MLSRDSADSLGATTQLTEGRVKPELVRHGPVSDVKGRHTTAPVIDFCWIAGPAHWRTEPGLTVSG